MTLVLTILVSLVSVAIVGWHGWAGKGHFASEGLPRGSMLLGLAVIASSIVYLVLLWTDQGPPLALVVGLLIELGAAMLFWRAMRASRAARLKLAFDPAHPHGIVRAGPYRFVRHPFYTSYLLFWIGWTVAAWSIWSLLPLALMAAIYVQAARSEERKFASSPLAEEYGAYRRQTGMFFPRLVQTQ